MFPISLRAPAVISMAVLVFAAGAQFAPAETATSSVSISRVQPLTGGKPLVSGYVNVIPVHLPFGFAVSLRNKSQDGRVIVVKVLVRFGRKDQPAFALKATGFVGPGRSATTRIVTKPRIAFAQRARLTVSVSDHARHTTTVRHYAVIFSLG
jgi:hypothetical protein